MTTTAKQALLRGLPSISDLLATETAQAWLAEHPRGVVTDSLRTAVEEIRRQIIADEGGRCRPMHVTADFVLLQAETLLRERTQPHLRAAVNATGIILHTGLGRAVWPASVVDSMMTELKGYTLLALDRESGQRKDRDQQIEYIITELTGAEAATVANNNAAATMLVLAALAAENEVIVSRGQLIEIGGAFRLPDVMEQSRAKLVEVGTTNRTHLRDYERAITDNTAAILRVHPSNFRVVGFTAEVPLAEMAQLAHEHGVLMIDDLGAGALVDLVPYGLPHEPTVQESVTTGADITLFSADKLIGASQAGIIVGKRALIERIRKHPLARAMRVDKSCLMALERTLHLFRDPERLAQTHPTYRMLATPLNVLEERATDLAAAMQQAVPTAKIAVREGSGYLGSGSLPMEALPGWLVAVELPDINAAELARRLRLDDSCIFTRIENEQVLFDVRTLTDTDVPIVAEALQKISKPQILTD